MNFDNGDLIGANVKANHDLLVKWQNYTVFARAVGFYDVVMNDHDVGARSEMTDAALGDVGRNYELLDAFVSADYTIADLPVNLRLGKQVINWGESTFILERQQRLQSDRRRRLPPSRFGNQGSARSGQRDLRLGLAAVRRLARRLLRARLGAV